MAPPPQPCVPMGFCCGKTPDTSHEIQAAELTPLKNEYAQFVGVSPEGNSFPRWPQICCLCVCTFITFLVVSILSLALYLFGPSGTVSVAQGDFNAVSRGPFGANGVPLSRTFGFPKSVSEALALEKAPNEVPIKGWAEVQEEGKQLPAKEWSGEWWRGNELGFLVYNPFFWKGTGIDPPSIALGIKPAQHVAIRPYLETLFGVSLADLKLAKELRKEILNFLAERREAGSLEVQGDLQIMVHKLLYHHTFGEHVSFEEASKFVAVQNDFLQYGVISEALPASFYPVVGGLMGLYDLQAKITEYVRQYGVLLEKRFGSELAALDCSPSPNCTVQLASAVFDALCAAGGASVPQLIGTGLGTLYSLDISNPVLNNTNATATDGSGQKVVDAKAFIGGKELQFFWEVLRYFPAVVGVPHWEKAPACSESGAAPGRRLEEMTDDDFLGVPAPTPSPPPAGVAPTKAPPPAPTPSTTQAPTQPPSETTQEATATMAPIVAPTVAPTADAADATANSTAADATASSTANATANATASATASAAATPCLDETWEAVERSGGKPQWGSGNRKLMNVANTMMRDKDAWGKDAKTFVLRDLKTYNQKSVGFAEMLVDDTVQDGKMNRNCPGKELALLIGTAFFKAFDVSAWTPSTTGILLQPASAKFSVGVFSLLPKEAEPARHSRPISV